MGCDGGTIPRRDELVRMKQKPEQKDKDAENVAKWKHCAITQEELRAPIVSCELGRLYNKESVLEFLLNRDEALHLASHIRNLKDIRELNLTENSGYTQRGAEKGDQYIDLQASRYICPVVGLEMNGKYRFCYLRECACVLSEKALKEVKSSVCLKCGKPFEEDDIIIINGTDEEIEIQRLKMEERRARSKLEKKSKKHKIKDGNITDTTEKKQKIENGESSASKADKKGNHNGDIRNCKLAGLGTSKKSNSSSAGTSTKLTVPDKAQSNYSIAKDPRASEAYKSLFTSHKNALNKPTAHWVTHNPLYY
ncbi:replication termination factor 2 [Tachypleus tridentatus]|uniref:replication termination factor 2 n=1 Tax=Tachypleus tridentatus TaxID=6853 RepID=UPI003FD377A1